MTAVSDLLDGLEAAAKAATPPTPIPSAPGYGVTPDGRVWSLASNWRGYGARPLAPAPDEDGYHKVRLQLDGRRVKCAVHVLVLSTLVGPKPSPAHQVRHLNGDNADNRVENLAWGTAKENAADRDAHGTTARGSRNGWARLTESDVREIRRRRAAGESQRAVGRDFGLMPQDVNRIVHRRAWAHVTDDDVTSAGASS